MNCSRNDNVAKYLRKCAALAVSTGVSEESFIAPIVQPMKAAASAAYKKSVEDSGKRLLKLRHGGWPADFVKIKETIK